MKWQNFLKVIFSFVTLATISTIVADVFGLITYKHFDLVCIIMFSIWLAFPIVFIFLSIKKRPAFIMQREKELIDLKPKNPLRFCPNDEELLKEEILSKTKEIRKEAEEKSVSHDESENTNQTDEEMTM